MDQQILWVVKLLQNLQQVKHYQPLWRPYCPFPHRPNSQDASFKIRSIASPSHLPYGLLSLHLFSTTNNKTGPSRHRRTPNSSSPPRFFEDGNAVKISFPPYRSRPSFEDHVVEICLAIVERSDLLSVPSSTGVHGSGLLHEDLQRRGYLPPFALLLNLWWDWCSLTVGHIFLFNFLIFVWICGFCEFYSVYFLWSFLNF